jgi:hypothetical protein
MGRVTDLFRRAVISRAVAISNRYESPHGDFSLSERRARGT